MAGIWWDRFRNQIRHPGTVLSFAQDWNSPMNDPAPCRHARTRLIAKDSDAEYVECLDCGAILEADERLEQEPGLEGSLSDA
jgi:hypothetical protein